MVTGCGGDPQPVDHHAYLEREVNVYRQPDEPSEKLSLRFYEEIPSVPYISAKEYFKKFFATDIASTTTGHDHKYYKTFNNYIGFDIEHNFFYSKGLELFNEHPNFISSKGKIYLRAESASSTKVQERVISLSNYSIKIFDDSNDAYAPISLLSSLMGGIAQYDVAYNGKDVYVFDMGGQLGSKTEAASFDDYYSVLADTSKKRERDLAEYTYNELCFVFDNLRGYTEQLVYGDNNLLTLGLNGLLDRYAPKVKKYLLSLDKEDYFEGITNLFYGLFDGGHTVLLSSFAEQAAAATRGSEPEFVEAYNYYRQLVLDKSTVQVSAIASRMSVFGTGSANNFYKYDDTYKTAYITFNRFTVDYEAWDDYYNGKGDIPLTTDTFAFVRDCFYRAYNDGAENLVLDLTSNGGGDTYALESIVGLLNGAKSEFKLNDTFNKYRSTINHLIDINLDGKFNNDDKVEADKFDFNVGVLTTPYAFSCGNLLPSVLKGLGYKILGEKSGGGSCAISIDSTADGLSYVHSSYVCFTDMAGNNIDGGVEVDFAIEHPLYPGGGLINYQQFFNMELVSAYLSTAYN